MLDDKQIVDACIKGVRTAQYQLYERYSGKLYALSLRYIKDKDDAKDVLQNAFIKIYENLNSFRPAGGLDEKNSYKYSITGDSK
jgi:DNA-directed RNA polymerase specialized sigma24 family protein